MKIIKEFHRIICLRRSMFNNISSTLPQNYFHNYHIPISNIQNSTGYLNKNELFSHKIAPICNTVISRNFSLSSLLSKGKDRGGKDKKKSKPSKIDISDLDSLIDSDNLTSQLSKAIEDMKQDFIKNLTLRSTTGAFEQIPINLDGKEYQLQELAQIARKPKLIVLNLSSFPTAIPHIIKAIEKSGLNINPQQDGTTIFLPIPKVTKEHRENLAKNAKTIFNKHKDELRKIRNKAVQTIQKKKKDVSIDTIHRGQDQVDALYHKFIQEAEVVLETKQNELLKSLD